jgi:hypothetical protein
MSLTGFQQNQKTINGYFTGLHSYERFFQRIIDDPRHLQFTVTSSSSYITLSFEGGVQSDDDLSGNNCNIDQNGHCSGD